MRIWEKLHRFVLDVYKASNTFPKSELFGLTSQVRRGAFSIPTNIAEGCGWDAKPDFLRFLHMAMGSASELEYLLQLANDLEFLDRENFFKLNQKNNRSAANVIFIFPNNKSS